MSAPDVLRRGLYLWRVTVVLLPLYVLALSLGGIALGGMFFAVAQAILADPVLLVVTLGFAAIFALMLMFFGLIAMVFGAVGVLLAPMFLVALARALSRILQGRSRGVAVSSAVALPAALLGILGVGLAVLAFVGDFTSQLIALGVVVLVVGLPAAGPMLLLLPHSRAWLTIRQARNAQLARPERHESPVPGAPMEEFEL